jgi:creatinine amidohydrolase
MALAHEQTHASLADLTWQEAASLPERSVLVVPVGASEQHGPHLPLSTDTDLAAALADALASQRGDVVVAPPLAYGSSGEHAGFAGTLSIGQEATELLLLELGRSASATFSRMLFLCAHGGNAEPVRRARRRLRDEGYDVAVFLPRWGLDAHAGRAETSLMLAIAPERVRLELAEPGTTESIQRLMPRLVRHGVRAVSASGVLGDPAGASAAEGTELLNAALTDLDALLESWSVDT